MLYKVEFYSTVARCWITSHNDGKGFKGHFEGFPHAYFTDLSKCRAKKVLRWKQAHAPNGREYRMTQMRWYG